MLATIELPNNKNEVDFILEVLKRLNVKIVENTNLSPTVEAISAEHIAILKERKTAMSAKDAQFFTWEEAQIILS